MRFPKKKESGLQNNNKENLTQELRMENQDNLKKQIVNLKEKLDHHLKWAFFGGVAIAIYKGDFYRKFEDIDIIIEDQEVLIRNLFENVDIKQRNNRKRGYLKIDDTSIEFLFMTRKNEIDLADGKFKFDSVKDLKFDNSILPVVDLHSLYCAKLRHKNALEIKKEHYKNKLENTNDDIKIIQKLMKN